MLYWLISALALLGVVLNIRKHPACFAIWTVTNTAWCLVDWEHGLYAQSALMAVYFLLSVWGLWRWTRNGGKR
jgi:nicotinamide riboside transporter PnuC